MTPINGLIKTGNWIIIITLFLEVITPFINSRGPPCVLFLQYFFVPSIATCPDGSFELSLQALRGGKEFRRRLLPPGVFSVGLLWLPCRSHTFWKGNWGTESWNCPPFLSKEVEWRRTETNRIYFLGRFYRLYNPLKRKEGCFYLAFQWHRLSTWVTRKGWILVWKAADLDKKPRQTTPMCFFLNSLRVGRQKSWSWLFFLGAKREVVEHVQLNNVKKTCLFPRRNESHPKDMGSVFLWTLGRSISLFQAFVNGWRFATNLNCGVYWVVKLHTKPSRSENSPNMRLSCLLPRSF